MSAAALRPSLIDHLFASQPEGPDRTSIAATLSSLLLHGSLVGAAIWASVRLSPSVATLTQDPTPPIFLAVPQSAPLPPAASAGKGGSSTQPGPTYSLPETPTMGIPDAKSNLDSEFATPNPVPGQTTPGSSGNNDTDPGAGTREDGFRILSVMPALLNAPAVREGLVRNYPVMLREAAIGGNVIVWVLLGEDGRVLRAELKQSSGHSALDEAALKVAPIMRFSPAMNRDQRVKVWVSVPIKFRAD